MTCVAAYAKNDKVYMCSDSAATSEQAIAIRSYSKVFKNGQFLIGFCGSFRLGQIIQYHFSAPKIKSKKITDEQLLEYFVKIFIPNLKSCLSENGFPDNEEEKTEWTLLVGIQGKIFTIENDYHVGHDVVQYAAIGSGEAYALGSMHTSRLQDPIKILTDAVNTAIFFTPSVRGPLHFEEI